MFFETKNNHQLPVVMRMMKLFMRFEYDSLLNKTFTEIKMTVSNNLDRMDFRDKILQWQYSAFKTCKEEMAVKSNQLG